MEIAKPMTPEKSSTSSTHNGYHYAENMNPNVSDRSPVATKSSNKSQKSISKNPIKNPFALRQRKFVVAKKKNNNNTQKQNDPVSCKCKDKDTTNGKCPCVAYQNLRASQEDFFKKKEEDEDEDVEEEEEEEEEEAESVVIEENEEFDELEGSGVVKRRRERVLEEARNSVPENGAGRVMHLVKAFEKLLSIPNSKKKEEQDDNGGESNSSNCNDNKKRVMKWALPGLQSNHQKHEAEVSASDTNSNSSLFCASDLVLTSQNLGLDQTVSISSSWDSSRASCSVSSRTSCGGRRSRRNSLESSGTIGGRKWKKKKQLKVTSQKPFKLRTEQRGKLKEEEFMNKIQQMMTEEEKLRIPIAQGLPWTTDEPECLVKPPVKERTKPIDLKLHSDVRAVDRAEFDHQVAEKMSLMEQYRLERERQQKLAEEEEIRRLRKELIPKAQPMPYFDRPFVPRRSMKHPTIPREPKFHIPHHKKIKCCTSWNDMSPYFSYLK